MKIGLIGYGKMGKMIEKEALLHHYEIVCVCDSIHWNFYDLAKADVCIEFTRPDAVLNNITKIAELKKNVVVGTTGWETDFKKIHQIVNQSKIGFLHSSNFSIGIHILLQLLEKASKIMNHFPQYDVAGVEYHHNQKKDSPSGTALEISSVIQDNMQRVDSLPFSSIRCGNIPGKHSVLFDSPTDSLLIQHEARNREGFAAGALLAANWMKDKTGIFSFKECMDELITRNPL